MWYEILPRILNMSLTAAVIILFVCICRLLLKKAPKIYSYALWSVVLFRLLCPVSLSAPVSLLGMFHAPVAEVSTENAEASTDMERVSTGTASAVEYIPFRIVHEEYPEITLPVGGSEGVVAETINQALPQGEEQLGADPLEAPVSLFTYLWMLGILVMLGRGVVSYIKLRHQLTGTQLLKENIYLADHIPGPFVMGLWNPKIYLPSGLQEKEQPYIILHEQHHIRRGDHFFKVLGYLALSIHWFNPLVWIAFRLFVKDMEMSCDEAVLRKLGEDIRADYSASLLQFAAGQKAVYGTPLAFGEGETKGRIRNLSAWKKPGRIISVVAIALCVIAILFCFFNPTLVKEALNINSRGVHIPELTQNKLEALYQQEFDKYNDKLPAEVRFSFKSLTYNGKVYTSNGHELALAYPADVPVTRWDTSLAEYPLEKICDVYGQRFIKPVYGDLNADGRYSDTYAWYDDASKVEGEYIQGTIWKFGEYDPENIVALTVPEVNGDGETMYRLYIYYHLNGIRLETGKDLLDKILNLMNARWYIVVGQMETNRMLDGEKPEDIYFLGDVYEGAVVTEKEVKDPDNYELINISEKEPYRRIITFRDYGDGIIGYPTPEGTVIYIATDRKEANETQEVTQERKRAEAIYEEVLEAYEEIDRVVYQRELKIEEMRRLIDENGTVYARVLDEEYKSIEDIEELLASVLTEKYIWENMSWVLETDEPLFIELDGELCMGVKYDKGIGFPSQIQLFYQFDDTHLKFLGYNEDNSYFVSLVKQGDRWLIDELGTVESAPENLLQQENANIPVEKKTTISGSFTVTVRDVIPDYTLYDDVPTVAVVTEFQGGPFTIYVGEEIGRQLKKDATYVFTIQPFEVDETKEELQFKALASIVQEYAAKFTVVDFRLAQENETGLASLNLTID